MKGDRVLLLESLTAGYDGVPAVRDLDLEVSEGEVVTLLGPNGAGKTTTLMVISGFVRMLAGNVEVLGEPVPRVRNAHHLARRGLMHVPENRGVLFQLSVRENLMLAKRRGPIDLDRLFHYFPQLEALLGRRGGQCSGGEQQMVALGRALLAEPRLLLIDEMSLGLAPIIFQTLTRVVRELADDTGMGVLLVEQYVEKALEISDRGYVMNHGTLVLSGSADNLSGDRAALDAAYMEM